MSNSPYLTMNQDTAALADLAEKLDALLQAGVVSLTATGYLQLNNSLTAQNPATNGRIRFSSATVPSLQYSNDGGTTWTDFSSDTIRWEAGTAYAVGDIVLYTDGWYVCIDATSITTAVPGVDANWRLLTSGTVIRYASNIAQFKAALEESATSVCIVLSGALSGNLAATVTAANVAIHSDEATSLTASSLSFTLSNGSSVYWHSHGTRIAASSSAVTLSASAARFYVDRLTVTNGTLTLSSNVKYQAVAGVFTGGTHALWDTLDSSGEYAPAKLEASLSAIPVEDTTKLYAEKAGTNGAHGYITVAGIVSKAASESMHYFQVDQQGLYANIPSAASVAYGYVYYATDNGNLYIRTTDAYDAAAWSPGIHIQGPAGTPGTDGDDGVSPTVSASAITGGHSVTITDVNNPTGITFNVMDGAPGQDGSTITLTAGSVSSIPYPGPAAVELVESPAGSHNYVANFTLVNGMAGSNAITATPPVVATTDAQGITNISINAAPAVVLESYTPAQATPTQADVTVVLGHAYEVTTEITTLNITPSGGTETITEGGTTTTINKYGSSVVKVLFGSSPAIIGTPAVTVVDTPTGGKYNLVNVVFFGASARVYIVDTWDPPAQS